MNNFWQRKTLLLGITLFLFANTLFSQTKWDVPADKKAKVADTKFDAKMVEHGKELFTKNCMSCHGTPGLGTNIKMSPLPRDPASKEYQANADGELFYKMTEGRGAMPSFKNSIEEKDRWAIISFIRSFNKAYVQPEPKAGAAVTGALSVTLQWKDGQKTLQVFVNQIDKTVKKPAGGCAVTLWAKRYFGELQLDESKTSNESGIVSFTLPKKLPGDSIGNIKLKIRVANDASGASTSKDTILKIGIPKHHVNVLDNREFWNVRSMAPIWLILAYCIGLVTVLGIIGYIGLLLFKIWKAGQD
jgi:mono/diheme cytochrome c family protein